MGVIADNLTSHGLSEAARSLIKVVENRFCRTCWEGCPSSWPQPRKCGTLRRASRVPTSQSPVHSNLENWHSVWISLQHFVYLCLFCESSVFKRILDTISWSSLDNAIETFAIWLFFRRNVWRRNMHCFFVYAVIHILLLYRTATH